LAMGVGSGSMGSQSGRVPRDAIYPLKRTDKKGLNKCPLIPWGINITIYHKLI